MIARLERVAEKKIEYKNFHEHDAIHVKSIDTKRRIMRNTTKNGKQFYEQC